MNEIMLKNIAIANLVYFLCYINKVQYKKYKYFWNLYLYNTKNIWPRANPNNIWFKLCTPKYILESGTITHNIKSTNAHILYLPYPILSEMIGSYNKLTAKLCPLGLPKSLGQNHSHFFILSSTQIGLDCWKDCLSKAMI